MPGEGRASTTYLRCDKSWMAVPSTAMTNWGGAGISADSSEVFGTGQPWAWPGHPRLRASLWPRRGFPGQARARRMSLRLACAPILIGLPGCGVPRGPALLQLLLRPRDRQPRAPVDLLAMRQQGFHPQGLAAMPVASVALAARRPALAAMHAADPLAAQRRLPAGAVVVLAARLAARGIGRIAAPVAVPEGSKGHGVNPNLAPPPLLLGEGRSCFNVLIVLICSPSCPVQVGLKGPRARVQRKVKLVHQ